MLENRLSSGFSRVIYSCGCPLQCGLVEPDISLFGMKLVIVLTLPTSTTSDFLLNGFMTTLMYDIAALSVI